MLHLPTKVGPPALVAALVVATLSTAACTSTHRGPIHPSQHGYSWVDAETVDGSRVVVKASPNPDRTFSWSTKDGEVIPDLEIRRLTYVRRGRGLLHGAGIGALSGAALGAALGFASGDDECTGLCFFDDAEDKALIGGLVLGAVGLGVGAVIGVLVGSRDVHEAPAARGRAPRLTVQPTANGGTAALTWTF